MKIPRIFSPEKTAADEVAGIMGEDFFYLYKKNPPLFREELDELKCRDPVLWGSIMKYVEREAEKLKGTKWEIKE